MVDNNNSIIAQSKIGKINMEKIRSNNILQNMRYYFFIFSLFVSLSTKSQQEENADTFDKRCFPNTNIGKSSFAIYGGAGYMPYTGKLASYYKPNFGGAMSLDYYHHNNLTFSLTIMGTNSRLREDVNVNNNLWTPKDTANFWSYGFTAGYSVFNKVHWRINPFGGIVLSQAELVSANGNKDRIGVKPSPVIGINFSYRFLQLNGNTSGGFGINARMTYVPFAINKKEVPFSGGICYMTIGVTFFNMGYIY